MSLKLLQNIIFVFVLLFSYVGAKKYDRNNSNRVASDKVNQAYNHWQEVLDTKNEICNQFSKLKGEWEKVRQNRDATLSEWNRSFSGFRKASFEWLTSHSQMSFFRQITTARNNCNEARNEEKRVRQKLKDINELEYFRYREQLKPSYNKN